MKKVWRFVRRWWWAFVAGAAVVLALAWKLVSPGRGADVDDGEDEQRPTFAERARNEVERVVLEGEVEKARIKATAEVQNEELDRIEEKAQEDPAEARRQIAAWLTRNL